MSERWWHPLPVTGAALALGQWWQRQRTLVLPPNAFRALQLAFAAGAIAVGYRWMDSYFSGDAWIVATAIAAIGTFLYGAFSRIWAIALLGQIFTIVTGVVFLRGIIFGHPGWAASLTPILALAAISSLVMRFVWPPFLAEFSSATLVARLYRLASTLLLCAWGFEYVPSHWRITFFIGIGAAMIVAGSAWPNQERAYSGLALQWLGLLMFWITSAGHVTWSELLTILAVPLSLRLGKRLQGKELLEIPARNALISVTTATAWLWVTRWTVAQSGANLTVAWAILALLLISAGFALRERIYRLGGLAVLTLAIGRVFFVDVWQLGSFFRILSVLVLGVILLLLGFAYNRFAEQIRRWL